jgi:hypothetical protein
MNNLKRGDVFTFRGKKFVVEVVNEGLVRFSNAFDIYDVYELPMCLLAGAEVVVGS